MTIKQAISRGTTQPRKLFLIDAVGASLSAFLLGVVLVELQPVFGIPIPTLYLLALFPCLFAVYDLCCYYLKASLIPPFLKGIAMMNVAYCLLSAGLAICHFEKITFWGWSYLVLEILIVFAIAIFEFKIASNLSIK